MTKIHYIKNGRLCNLKIINYDDSEGDGSDNDVLCHTILEMFMISWLCIIIPAFMSNFVLEIWEVSTTTTA